MAAPVKPRSPEPYRELTTAADITEDIEEMIRDCVEGWFLDSPLGEDFIDRLSDDYGATANPLTGETEGWEILNYDNAAARKVLRIARAHKQECNS